ncbi:MAG: ABC transporter ATP-binding protein [Proteobacteria bacterium]|nr:ABC transporter ATP-binding protein [Desulfobulbaceae bacterium]MBU4153982.1 ABC transporter ATP-binding protein [Pseudomonadota bacterium]
MRSDHKSIVVEGLSKCFGSFKAVDRIDLSVDRGEFFGFLGPNGAGKTTTIKMLAGLLKPDEGSILINGRDLIREPTICKQQTGYIPDRPFLYEKLTGLEFLKFMASLYQLPVQQFNDKTDYYLELFDLLSWRDHLIESYSHGMRQKLIMTSALMLALPVLIVDEPMVGLDPKSARLVKELFKKHAEAGGSIFLSTHSLEIAEELCDRIAIVIDGRLRVTGNLADLRRETHLLDSGLEDIFLQLTGAHELQSVISALRSEGR